MDLTSSSKKRMRPISSPDTPILSVMPSAKKKCYGVNKFEEESIVLPSTPLIQSSTPTYGFSELDSRPFSIPSEPKKSCEVYSTTEGSNDNVFSEFQDLTRSVLATPDRDLTIPDPPLRPAKRSLSTKSKTRREEPESEVISLIDLAAQVPISARRLLRMANSTVAKVPNRPKPCLSRCETEPSLSEIKKKKLSAPSSIMEVSHGHSSGGTLPTQQEVSDTVTVENRNSENENTFPFLMDTTTQILSPKPIRVLSPLRLHYSEPNILYHERISRSKNNSDTSIPVICTQITEKHTPPLDGAHGSSKQTSIDHSPTMYGETPRLLTLEDSYEDPPEDIILPEHLPSITSPIPLEIHDSVDDSIHDPSIQNNSSISNQEQSLQTECPASLYSSLFQIDGEEKQIQSEREFPVLEATLTQNSISPFGRVLLNNNDSELQRSKNKKILVSNSTVSNIPTPETRTWEESLSTIQVDPRFQGSMFSMAKYSKLQRVKQPDSYGSSKLKDKADSDYIQQSGLSPLKTITNKTGISCKKVKSPRNSSNIDSSEIDKSIKSKHTLKKSYHPTSPSRPYLGLEGRQRSSLGTRNMFHTITHPITFSSTSSRVGRKQNHDEKFPDFPSGRFSNNETTTQSGRVADNSTNTQLDNFSQSSGYLNGSQSHQNEISDWEAISIDPNDSISGITQHSPMKVNSLLLNLDCLNSAVISQPICSENLEKLKTDILRFLARVEEDFRYLEKSSETFTSIEASLAVLKKKFLSLIEHQRGSFPEIQVQDNPDFFPHIVYPSNCSSNDSEQDKTIPVSVFDHFSVYPKISHPAPPNWMESVPKLHFSVDNLDKPKTGIGELFRIKDSRHDKPIFRVESMGPLPSPNGINSFRKNSFTNQFGNLEDRTFDSTY